MDWSSLVVSHGASTVCLGLATATAVTIVISIIIVTGITVIVVALRGISR